MVLEWLASLTEGQKLSITPCGHHVFCCGSIIIILSLVQFLFSFVLCKIMYFQLMIAKQRKITRHNQRLSKRV